MVVGVLERSAPNLELNAGSASGITGRRVLFATLVVTTIAFLLVLAGCSSVQPKTYEVCPTVATPEVPPAPHYAVQDLKANARAPQVIQACAVSLQSCIGYTDELITTFKPQLPKE